MLGGITEVRSAWTSAIRISCISALLVSACGGEAPVAPAPPAPAPVVHLTILADADLNPNKAGRASPVLLRIFQLSESAEFLSAEFDAITARGKDTRSGVLVRREERMVQPGSKEVLEVALEPEARVLGVVAEYSDLNHSNWRAVHPVEESAAQAPLAIRLRSLGVAFERAAPSTGH